LYVSNTEGYRGSIHTAISDRESHGITPYERDPIDLAGCSDFLRSKREHRPGKIDPEDARRPASTCLQSDIGGSRAHIQECFTPRELKRGDRLGSPPPIDAGAEKMIQEIVSGGDRVEHSSDAIW
jgi:hypothetical protein